MKSIFFFLLAVTAVAGLRGQAKPFRAAEAESHCWKVCYKGACAQRCTTPLDAEQLLVTYDDGHNVTVTTEGCTKICYKGACITHCTKADNEIVSQGHLTLTKITPQSTGHCWKVCYKGACIQHCSKAMEEPLSITDDLTVTHVDNTPTPMGHCWKACYKGACIQHCSDYADGLVNFDQLSLTLQATPAAEELEAIPIQAESCIMNKLCKAACKVAPDFKGCSLLCDHVHKC
ncbi:hypothetical protein PROFUN_05635 [Planoprotostelium fungivorum]|uniref:Uncharacterized protein n=1 Tax=Planoprotostelium fungivorum TaxID=1890364 RepID=A0A2P6MUG8_9EUKA|nr:hypothetical protein PROFUN_05635 [Planoprotostelium fungivorum]